ncbi:MAG: NAD(P)-dependent glycerol-3-phosphate dehydrogenase [Oscillospiraceae bacterium]|jgi:glycerol-3-phosphate dehydrogenase (NAD(P)+)|nr:NAD(P)-dependent glycerol-3-phosphate dehydrogenase [Oscillospiraceae bacterium]
MKVSVIGCGFGLALAKLWSGRHEVVLYTKFAEEADVLRRTRENVRVLPGVLLPDSVRVTSDAADIKGADYTVFAVPSQFLDSTCAELIPYLTGTIISVGKGFINIDGKPERLSEIIKTHYPHHPVSVISGPCHAEEVGRGIVTCAVCANSADNASDTDIVNTLSTDTFRLYNSSDLIGVEIGGALKNPIALCAGVLKGYEAQNKLHGIATTGDNTFAALVTRGLAEITRLGTEMGADANTFSGLSGIGDLIVTCGSEHSRNRRAGFLIGQGMSAADAVKQVGTVEGYTALPAMRDLAHQYRVSAPIAEELYGVCFENKSPAEAIYNLVTRPYKQER